MFSSPCFSHSSCAPVPMSSVLSISLPHPFTCASYSYVLCCAGSIMCCRPAPVLVFVCAAPHVGSCLISFTFAHQLFYRCTPFLLRFTLHVLRFSALLMCFTHSCLCCPFRFSNMLIHDFPPHVLCFTCFPLLAPPTERHPTVRWILVGCWHVARMCHTLPIPLVPMIP